MAIKLLSDIDGVVKDNNEDTLDELKMLLDLITHQDAAFWQWGYGIAIQIFVNGLPEIRVDTELLIEVIEYLENVHGSSFNEYFTDIINNLRVVTFYGSLYDPNSQFWVSGQEHVVKRELILPSEYVFTVHNHYFFQH